MKAQLPILCARDKAACNCALEAAIGGFGPCNINGAIQQGYNTSHPLCPVREFVFYINVNTHPFM